MNAAQAQIVQLIQSEAQSQGLDPAVALQVAQIESGFDQRAVGKAGEIGVFQLMPATARDLGVNPYNLLDNIRGGVRYLKQLLLQFNGNLAQALAAYNAGPGRVGRAVESGDWFSRIPAMTRQYVTKILAALGIGTVTPSLPPASASGAPIVIPGGNYIWAGQPTVPQASGFLPWALLGAGALAIYSIV